MAPQKLSLQLEIVVRIILIVFFLYTDDAKGFFRKIQPEEFWLYKFPRTQSYYPSRYLWLTVTFVPIATIGVTYSKTKDKIDALQAFLGAVLSVFLAGSITNCIKLGVGRPRPDFLARCFPDGNIDVSLKCTGSEEEVIQGYKSFPSGHSAMSYSCMVYVSLYIAGKLHTFTSIGRGSALRLILVIIPLLWATMIAVSRTADYHHHWQDVTVGGALGSVVAFTVYRQYYPSVSRLNSHLPYISLSPIDTQLIAHDRQMSPVTSPTTAVNMGHIMDVKER